MPELIRPLNRPDDGSGSLPELPADEAPAINYNCRQRNFQLPLDTQTASIIGDANNQPTMDTAKFDQLVKSHQIRYALQKHAGELNPKQFDFCVKKCPSLAIESAFTLLTQEQRDFCLQKAPYAAIENLEELEKLGYKLSPAEFDFCVRRYPDGALKHVADRLNPKQLDFCRRKMPEDALEHAPKKLSPKQLALCYRKKPHMALQYAASLLSPKQLAFCVRKRPYKALQHAASLLSPRQLAFCFDKHPDTAVERAASLLSPKQLAFCVEEYPWETLLFAAGLISPKQLLACVSRRRFKLNNYLRKSANESPELVRALMAVVSQLSPTTAEAVAKVSAESI